MSGWPGRGPDRPLFMGLTWCSQAKCSQAGMHMHGELGKPSSSITEHQAHAPRLRRVLASVANSSCDNPAPRPVMA